MMARGQCQHRAGTWREETLLCLLLPTLQTSRWAAAAGAWGGLNPSSDPAAVWGGAGLTAGSCAVRETQLLQHTQTLLQPPCTRLHLSEGPGPRLGSPSRSPFCCPASEQSWLCPRVKHRFSQIAA